MEDYENRAMTEAKGIMQKRTRTFVSDDIRVATSVTAESVVGEIDAHIANFTYYELAQDLELLGSVSVTENHWNVELEEVEKRWVRL